jgi:chromosome segregation ATPase
MVVIAGGSWDPDADRSLEMTRTEHDASWPGVEVVQVDLGSSLPGVVTLFASELARLRHELDTAGYDRDRSRAHLKRHRDRRQADAAEQRRLREEVDRLAALRGQLEGECAALRDQVEEQRNRCEAGLRALDLTAAQLGSALRQRDHLTATGVAQRQQIDALESSLIAAQEEGEAARDEARRGHDDLIHLRHTLELSERREQAARAESSRLSASGVALQHRLQALESALNASRDEADTARDEVRRGHEELIHFRHMLELAERREQAVAAEKHGLSATGAELQQQLRALETALSAAREEAESARDEAQCAQEDLLHLRHTLELAERREQAALVENNVLLNSAGELRAKLGAFEIALSAAREEAERARDEVQCRQEDLLHVCHTLELAERREQAAAAENSGLSATNAELQQQLRALESVLSGAREDAKAAREEVRRKHQDHVQLRLDLERAQRLEQATAGENRALCEQARVRQVESEREQQRALAERQELHQRLTALQAELESEQTQGRAVLDEARRQFLEQLRALHEKNELSRSETERMRRERDLARSELQGLAQNQELLDQTLAMVEAAHESAQEQARAESARWEAALAEAEGRNESISIRCDEQDQELQELRAELDRLRMEPAAVPTNGRGHAVEAAVGRPRLDESWTTHRGSEGYRGTLSSCLSQNPDAWTNSERPLMLNSGTSRHSAYLPEESPSREFPSDVDLGLVRAQVEMLNGLLSTEQSAGQVLIYQQRLAEFALKIREASRLATNLANEVEQSRRRDEMQFHMYLVRRAEEIEKPRA